MKNSKFKIGRWLGLLPLAFCPLPCLAQPSPVPAATQAEVDAGTVARKYVSPLTLANKAGLSATDARFTSSAGQILSTSNNFVAPLFTGNGTGLSNVVVLNLTNATSSNIGTPTMADKFVEFSTNGVLNLTGIIIDPAAPAGVQYWRGMILNTSGSTKTYTIASSFVCAGGGTLFNTNDATITIEYWPGLRTNLIFQCVR